MKKVSFVKANPVRHWVGDGFPVRSIFNYNEQVQEMSPFLLMDYAGPVEFAPTTQRLGVGEHPHRGFETVTIVYEGEVEHRDSSGGGGLIRPGDVQWMTAGGGLVHDEFHGREFAKKGGRFEMIQLWVNLPKKHKMTKPTYQPLLNEEIPVVPLPKDAGFVRVIAGKFQGALGPARTFSPINLWDVTCHKVNGGNKVQFEVPAAHTTALFVLKGQIKFVDEETGAQNIIQPGEMAVLEREGQIVSFEILENARLLLMNGEPLNEPVEAFGPFIMNTKLEIRQAMLDYESGKMGKLS